MKKLRRAQLAWIAQAALIVLPVVILSGVALHFLREDRNAIEKDARDRAVSLAPEMARRIGEQLSSFLVYSPKKGLVTQQRIVYGETFAAPGYSRVPVPSPWAASLPPREAQLWRIAQDARFLRPDAEAANEALMALTGPGIPNAARANAQLGLLVAAEPHSDSAALIRRAVALAGQFPGEVTESGVPVGDLALLLALRHTVKGSIPPELNAAIEKNLTRNPSFLSTDLLDAAGGDTPLRATWLKQQAGRDATRNLMQTLASRLANRRATPTILVYPALPNQGLALCTPQSGGWQVLLVQVPPEILGRDLLANLPDYMGASLRLQTDVWDLGERRGAKGTPLAFASGSVLTYKFPFQLVLDRRNPELLYAPYRRRLLLTQGLILSAVAAALLGLWRLWHTYRDQMRLHEMKSNLVSSVSHELRAPLAAVRLMAESLESGRVDNAEKQNDYYRLIVRECRRLSSLVENVLDFSRIDRGLKQYHLEPVDALALLRHTVMLMEPGAAERQVRLRLAEPPPDFETLQPSWDSEAVEQSMVNLLDNAIKHSPSDAEVLVEVELLPTVVRFWVADAGPGIPAEEQQKIFDLFYRYGSELRRETEGVGIGLSIVKHVADAHGGQVLVESKLGQGSRFGLELPR